MISRIAQTSRRLSVLTVSAFLISLVFAVVPASAQTAVATPSYTQADVSFVSALDLMEGHVRVSFGLWNLQQYDLSALHAGQPLQDLYASIETALKAAGKDKPL